ncbi:metallophosphoesterase [Sneathiella limimaris]|uniref:metallophosphoesterase n=1 Tax=Sneathiella limimaris TaxID=1964213 RepID=UPI00146E3CF0|nr:metallophosphoesterase [Sneathiella limimaris]
MFGLFPKKKLRVKLPDNTRVIAIGDIHGQHKRLSKLMKEVDLYRKKNPIDHETIVFLGDYVDRGPHSAKIIDYLRKRAKAAKTAAHTEVFLQGNHEELMIEGLDVEGTRHDLWWRNGGLQTVNSYLKFLKIEVPEDLGAEERLNIFREHFPKKHSKFVHSLQNIYRVGPLVFAHAGIRMDKAPGKQKQQDLRWIRDPFLYWEGKNKDFLVVHGHSITPSFKPEIHAHRVALDTGSYKLKGKITAGIFEGNTVRFVSNGTRKGFNTNKFS